MSDPDLLDAFRKQCKIAGPFLTLLAWKDQQGVDFDDLIDIAKEFDDPAPKVRSNIESDEK